MPSLREQSRSHWKMVSFGTARDTPALLPRVTGGLAFVESAGNGCAAAGLHGDHLWPAARRAPAELLHLFECLPHADESDAAAGGVEDRVGILPVELLHELVAHG